MPRHRMIGRIVGASFQSNPPSGDDENDEANEPNEQQPPNGSESGKPSSKPITATFDRGQQAQVNRIVKREVDTAVAEARRQWEADQDDAQRDRMREGLAEQQKYRDLADDLQRELDGYTDQRGNPHEGLRAKVARLERELGEWNRISDEEYTKALEELPSFLKTFAPGANASGIVKRKWVADARNAAREAGLPNGFAPPIPRDPDPDNPDDVEAVAAQEQRRLRRDPSYNRF